MTTATYTCRYCRQSSEPTGEACPMCGAPFDVRRQVSRSGWERLPAIRDMARIQFGRSRVQISGTQVPVADFDLAPDDWIYFNHHTLLWTDAGTRLGNSDLSGGLRRVMAGLSLIMMEAHGPGRLGLSDNHAGDVVALPLRQGQSLIVREHRFLCASGGLNYSWNASPVWYVTGTGDDRETHYPQGRYEDVFTAGGGPALLLLHAPGDTFIRDLAPDETILVQPSAVLYRDVTVRLHLHLEYPRAGGGVGSWRRYSMRNVWVRLIGPGRVAVQSIFARPENAEPIRNSSYATTLQW